MQRDGGRKIDGIVLHRTRAWRDGDLVRRDGLLLTSPARTLLDVAPFTGDDALEKLIRRGQYAGLLADDEARVVVEADAHGRALGREADLERDADLLAVGWAMIRVTRHRLRRTRRATAQQVLATVRDRTPMRAAA